MDRAIKFLSPQDALPQQEFENFSYTFDNEIAMLASLTHTHISKIMDFGEMHSGDRYYKYYVMDYIEGKHFNEAWTDGHFTGRAFLRTVDQLLAAVEHLHGASIMHCDIKGENVVVRRDGDSFFATLVDLGVAKIIDPLKSNLPSLHTDRSTYFFATREITRPEWRARRGRRISQGELDEMFPHHDFYGLGVIIDKATEDKRIRASLQDELGSAGFKALKTIQERLTGRPSEPYYNDISRVRQDWGKLDRSYLAPLGVPELAVAANVKTSVATPLGRVSLTERIEEIVNHPLFQRLRDIPQLEFVSLVYPGATHSRLLHSLTTFDIARQYIGHLLNDPTFRLLVEPFEIEAALLLALLHDIGHYPLSHMFEDLSAERKKAGRLTIPSDDDLFWCFIDPETTRSGPFGAYENIIAEELELRTGGIESLHSYLSSLFDDRTIMAMHGIIDRKQPGRRLLAGLLSSAIDVDKVAYLQDDSVMTGARYGLGIDLDALLGSLIAPYSDDIQGDEPVIAIADKGLPAAEATVLARYWMHKRVYWHHTNRSIMAMFKFVIAELLERQAIQMEEYWRRALFSTATASLQYLSDKFDEELDAIRLSVGRPVRNPLRGILPGNRVLYKRVLTIAFGPEAQDRQLYAALAYKRWPEISDFAERLLGALEESFGSGNRLTHGDLLLDVPMKRREDPGGDRGGKAIVYLQRDPTVAQNLYSGQNPASPLLGCLREEFDLHVKKCRLFFHPALYKELEERMDDVREVLKHALSEECGL
jgi:HD superfamily phosphohydrolase